MPIVRQNPKNMKADVIVDLQYGDCGKGKISHHLLKSGEYTHSLRFNGGCNAGHTIYHDGKKFITHHIPAGVFFGIKSIIGPGCIVNPEKFFQEIESIKSGGVDVSNIFIANNTHITLPEYLLAESEAAEKIGTTKTGNGETYWRKYARSGLRAESIEELKPFLIDIYKEFHFADKEPIILAEGAQGFGLDIDWGDYPYVTSSNCTVGAAVLNAIPYDAIRDVWGVAKVYETYVGAKQFEPDNPIFNQIREKGNEYGATTGRPRQCNWLNWNLLEKAARINGVKKLVFNKTDILRDLDKWFVLENGKEINLQTEQKFKEWILEKLHNIGIQEANVFFSDNPETI